MTVHSILLIVATALTITVFLGLAIFVVGRNPRQPVSWIFSALCLTIAGMYFSSLFMVARPETPLPLALFFLRLKWLAITFSPTLFLHLVFFYFPPGWQRYRLWILRPLYLLDSGLGMAILFTNLIIAGYHDHSPPHIIGSTPGPLMPLLTGLFMLQVSGSAAGLIVSYRTTPSLAFRYQILYLLIPTGLVFLSSTIHWIVLIKDADQIPHEIPDALLLLAAFLYTRSVVHFGSFIGRPVTGRRLFYLVLTAALGLVALYLTLTIDGWLEPYTHFPLPPVTSILILILVAGFPTAGRWITAWLDRRLFPAAREQEALITDLAEALLESPDFEQLQVDLLETLCAVLDVREGYIATSGPTAPPNYFIVQAVRGNSALQPGERIPRPPSNIPTDTPQLVTPALGPLQTVSSQQNFTLICPLTIDQAMDGLLALGEKRDGTPFTSQEINLCTELVNKTNTFERVVRLREKQAAYLEAAQQQSQVLQQLSQATTVPVHHSPLTDLTVPLEIKILGPLQIIREGHLIPESVWGSERAKVLLAYLLWKSPAGATREELCETLWPDRSPTDTANVFHVTLHRLRRVLQPSRRDGATSDYIQHDRGRYRFNLEAAYWLDLDAFQELAAQADPVALKTVVELYRGYYLEDTIWALPPDVEAQQRKFEQLYVNALRRLIAQTEGRETLVYLEKLLMIEPADETAYQALVLGYLAQGRADLARRQVTKWQQALLEFELEPSFETLALWDRVETKNGHTP